MNSPQKLVEILIFKKKNEDEFKRIVSFDDRTFIFETYGSCKWFMTYGKEMLASRDAQHAFEEHAPRNASSVIKRVYDLLFSVREDKNELDASTEYPDED